MSSPAQPDVPIWTTVQELLVDDDRVTPQLQGFLSLAVPAGVMSATLYLEVPNDLTAAQINKRLRLPIMEALSHIGEEVTSYRRRREPRTGPSSRRHRSPSADFDRHEQVRVESPMEQPTQLRHESRLNPKYTFDNFVIGQSNRFAHAAAGRCRRSAGQGVQPSVHLRATRASARRTSSTRSETTHSPSMQG